MTDVLVVGGGPAGSSTAWHLARAGVRVRLLDRAHFPRPKPCAEYLSPQASRVLAAMGALDACERAGAAQLAGMIIRAPGGARIHGDFVAAHGWRGFRDRGLALRRVLLDRILLDQARAAGVEVVEGARVTDLERDGQGMVRGARTLETAGARVHRATIVVGADGLRSVIARRLGLARRAWRPRRLALLAHYRGVEGVGDYGEMFVERGGYAGIAAVDDGIANVAVVVPVALSAAVAGNPECFFEQWLHARQHLARRFRGAVRVSRVHATGPFAQRARRAWSSGAALVGDAADFFDPFTGEGIYAALRGGEMLAPHVVHALGAPSRRFADSSLEAYDLDRRLEFGGKWTVERIVGLAVGVPWLMDRAARALAARKDMADLLVGVTGDFVPAREVLRPSYVLRLVAGALRPSLAGVPAPVPE